MGACFQSMTVRGGGSRNEARAAFTAQQERDRAYYGSNPYGGHLGLKSGLIFHDLMCAFASEREAEDYLVSGPGDTGKWGPAVAVRYRTGEGDEVDWLIGGWCPE